MFVKNNAVHAEFSEKNGALLGIRHHGAELARPAADLFTLQMLDRAGNAKLLRAREFAEFQYADGCFRYAGHPVFKDLNVAVRVTADEVFLRFRIGIVGVPADHVLEWVDGPQVFFANDRKLFQPKHDGVVITDLTERNRNSASCYHPIKFADRAVNYGSFFPGRAQMQFMAAYGEDGGIYFAAHDRACTTKAVEYEPFETGVTRLSLQTFTGCDFGENYETPFDYVLAAFDGGWMEAASIYRDWFEQGVPPAAKFPAWMEESPVVLIYPVRGHGKDTGEMEPNCYYPYCNMLSYVDAFNRKLEAPVMPLLMHWEGTAPWAPPYVWPPFGGEKPLAEFRDKLHKMGNRLGLYCSGTAWTCKSMITDYAPGCTPEQQKDMMRGAKGEIDASVCNGVDSQRLGYDMCLTEEWPRRTVRAEIQKMEAFGIDYAQFFDQNHGGCFHLCYARNHHHPPVPGAWQIAAMRSLLAEIASESGTMALGCESAAAEPYIHALPLNDARASFMRTCGTPVPAQAFVFHGRTLCFSGNQGGTQWAIDFQKSPENLLYRLSCAFHAGDLLALLLKEDGRIHWCWGLEWSEPEPEQESVCTLVRNLNRVRKRYPEFLLYGRMLKPQHRISGGQWSIFGQGGTEQKVDSFLHSSWQSPAGEVMTYVTNFLPRTQTVNIDGRPVELPPLDACSIEDGEA